jgi:SAM-dependent methyltransferase
MRGSKMGKLNYLTRCTCRQIDPRRFACPNCGGVHNKIVSRKYVVTSLRRCANCWLQFRAPTDDPAHNSRFYEDEYSAGFTTEMPSDADLSNLIACDFAGEKSWAYYNAVLKYLGLGSGARVFDFGCSWGYGSFQMIKAGYSVFAFEISPTRRKYAEEKLCVRTIANMDQATTASGWAGTFDCFFSSHVLEHVPSPSRVFGFAEALLKRGGIFVSFTPNGSEGGRGSHPAWDKWWGEVHPNLIDDRFLDHAFRHWPRIAGSFAADQIQFPSKPEMRYLDQLSGSELFFAAKKQ